MVGVTVCVSIDGKAGVCGSLPLDSGMGVSIDAVTGEYDGTSSRLCGYGSAVSYF